MTLTSLAWDSRPFRIALLISLAVNLFFVAAIVTLAVRSYLIPPSTEFELPRTAEARIDRLAATLPAADAAGLHAQFAAKRTEAESTRETYDRALDRVKAALRAEPLDLDALHATMANARQARQGLDEVLQGIIAAAVARMSPEGRNRLADWRPYRAAANCPH
jgi:uncharacterized membrane protein